MRKCRGSPNHNATARGDADKPEVQAMAKARPSEQARALGERAETRKEQAEARIEEAEARTERAVARTELAEARTERAVARQELSEARLEQVEVQIEQAVYTSELRYRRLFEAALDGILQVFRAGDYQVPVQFRNLGNDVAGIYVWYP